MGSCILTPSVVLNGKEQDSRLYKDLLSYTGGNRDSALDLYVIATHNKVKVKEGIVLDELGEPTLKSFMDVTKANEHLVNVNNSIDEIQQGFREDNGEAVVYPSTAEANGHAAMYNAKQDNKVAIIEGSRGNRTVSIKDAAPDTKLKALEQKGAVALNSRIRELMKQMGFTAVVDTDLAFEGLFDPLRATKTADGLLTVIRIAEGQIGEDALPEEFSHLMIAGMKDNPLVQRLLNMMKQEGVVESVLGSEYQAYLDEYGNDIDRLAEEAAGKVLTKAIKNEATTSKQQQVINQAKSLIQRIWEAFKRLVGNVSEQDVKSVIEDANMLAASMSMDIMKGKYVNKISKVDIMRHSKPLAAINKRLNDVEARTNQMIDAVKHQLSVLTHKYGETMNDMNPEERKRISNSIREAEKMIAAGMSVSASRTILKETRAQLESLIKKQDQAIKDYDKFLRENPNATNRERVNALNVMITEIAKLKDAIALYKPTLQAMQNFDMDYKSSQLSSFMGSNISESDAAELSSIANSVLSILNGIEGDYEHYKREATKELLILYWPEGIDSPEEIERLATELTIKADADISVFDRYVGSMSESGDLFSSIVKRAIAEAQSNRDLALREMVNEVTKAHNKLAMSGTEDTSFLLERDKKGVPTGRTISNIDYEAYYKAKKAHLEMLKQDPNNTRFDLAIAMKKWEMENTEVITVQTLDGEVEMRVPEHTAEGKYYSGELDRANFTPAQREYYDDYIKIKATLDNMIPGAAKNNLHRSIMRMKDTQEMMTASKNISFGDAIKEHISRSVRKTEDDIEYGSESLAEGFDMDDVEEAINEQVVETDGEGNIIKRIPVFYQKRLQDMNMLSEDTTGSLASYAAMAINYATMSESVVLMEVVADTAKDRTIQSEYGDKKLVRKIVEFGKERTIEVGEKGGLSYERLRLDINRAFYQQYKVNEGSFNIGKYKIDTAHLIDTIRGMTAQFALGFNITGSINNVLAGRMQLMYEAFAGEHFSHKDTLFAEKEYAKLAGGYLAEAYATVKTNKLSLMEQLIDPAGDFYSDTSTMRARQSGAARAFSGMSTLFGYSAGEQYLRSKVMISMMNAMRLKDKNGKDISAWDAFEVIEEKGGGYTQTKGKVETKSPTKLSV